MAHVERTTAAARPAAPEDDQRAEYRWAFNAWVFLFLGVICAGLLNYLGLYAKTFYPGL